MRREKLPPKETVALLQEVAGKTSREVERVLVSKAVEPRREERVRAITAELTRVTMEVDGEFLKLAQQIKDLKGDPSLALQETLKTAMREYVKKREPKSLLGAPKVRMTPVQRGSKARYIPVDERTFVKHRSEGRCEFVDPVTERRCESRSGLEFDHIKPFAMGGAHTSENLRHYCRAHNMLAAIEQFGTEKMEPYLKL